MISPIDVFDAVSKGNDEYADNLRKAITGSQEMGYRKGLMDAMNFFFKEIEHTSANIVVLEKFMKQFPANNQNKS